MAIYRLSIKIFSRGKGASAVAKSAYRAAELIKSDYDGREHDYTRKRGVIHKEILLPEHAPLEYADRAVLWNAVEKAEKNDNAQLARELELALPVELTREQNIELAREFVQRHFVSVGMCADVCVHYAKKNNPHAHVMLTMRPFNEDGEWGAKSRKEYILNSRGERIKLPSGEFKTRKICSIDWNEQTKAEEWRAAWSDAVNAALEKENHTARVDHRSYKRQGVDIIPQVRMGVAATQMERRGIRTELGDKNRAIAVTNQQLGQLRARINKIKEWAYAQPIQDAPTIGEMMSAINRGQEIKSHWKRIADLKTAAKVLIFLQENHITSVEQLADKVTDIHQERYDLANTIKAQERRISTLNEHLAQVDIFNQHKAVCAKYKNLTPKKDTAALNSLNPFTRNKAAKDYEAAVKKQAAYYEKHADAIEQYNAASKYLKDHLNGRTVIPEKDWREEQKRLLAERYDHVEAYYKLREDVRSVEVLRRGAESLMREVTPERTPSRTQDMEL